MVGLGTQDDLAQANDFVDRFDLTITMLWDASFQSWLELGVALQPSAHLYAADGTLLKRWLGPFDEEEALALAASSQPAGAETAAAATPARFCRYVDRFARAQRDAGGWPGAGEDGRQRILDDLRFAANAAAQTSSVELATITGELAAAVRAHSEALIVNGLPDDAGSAPGAGVTAVALTDALGAAAPAFASACDVEVDRAATP